MRLLLPIALLALAAAPATAQDACTEANPCPWEVIVDASGFVGESEWNWTAGDWMLLNVANDDGVAHTVSLSGYSLQLQVPADGEANKAVQLSQAGHFKLSDAPSGDTVDVTVVNGDVVDYEKGFIDANGNAATPGSSSTRMPGLELPILALALVAVALARRA